MLQDLDHDSGKIASISPEDPLAPNGAVRWICSELPLAPSEAVRWNESSGQQDLNDAKTSQPLAPSLVECGLRGRASITIQPLAPSHFSMQPWPPENCALDVARGGVLPVAAS